MDSSETYAFEMSHETGSSKNKVKVTTKFKASAVAPRRRARFACPRRRRSRARARLPRATPPLLPPRVAAQIERKYEPIKVLGHGAFRAPARAALSS